MEETIKKFRFKDKGIVINAPAEMEREFKSYGFQTGFVERVKSANTVVFINNRKEALEFLNHNLKIIEPDSVLWFSYPKGMSKIKTDINRDTLREIAEEYGITTVTAISINDTWSGLRFRPIDKVGT